MKLLILTDLYPFDDNMTAGMFIKKRIDEYVKNNIEFDVYSILPVDCPLIKIVKSFIKKRYVKKQRTLNFGSWNWNYIMINNYLSDEICRRYSVKDRNSKAINAIKKRIDINKYDLVLCHWAYPVGMYGKMLKEEFNKPYIVFSHGTDIHSVPYRNKVIAEKTKIALNSADCAVFVSDDLRKKAEFFGFNNNFRIIPNGIDSTIFKLNPSKGKELAVGFAGNLLPVKGADRLPQIFANIQKKREDISFYIIGDGPLDKQISQQLSELNVKNVIFTGRINQEKLAEYFSKIDILIVPSRNEGFPCIVLEANACGVYVVGTNTGGIPEAVGNTGSIIENNEKLEESFANEILNKLETEIDYTGISNRAMNYTWSNLFCKEKEIFDELIR